MTTLSENAELSKSLKGVCVAYVMENLQEEFVVSPSGVPLFADRLNGDGTLSEDVDEGEYISALDQFIFSGKTLDGQRVLDVILSVKDLVSKEEKEILAEWRDCAFESVFEIIRLFEGGFHVMDVVAEVEYDVHGNDPNPKTFLDAFPDVRPGHFLLTRIAPVRGMWFFSGTQTPMSPSMEQTIFEIVILKSSPEAQYRNNPEKRAQCFAIQKEQYDHFVSHFGADELIVSGNRVKEKEREFYSSWTESIGGDPEKVPESPVHYDDDFQDEEGVGLLMDDQDGFYIISGYEEFCDAFLDFSMPKGQRATVIKETLEEDSVPALCFRRMREQHPESFREAIALALPVFVKKHDPVKDFDVLMDRYKPGWREVVPSVSVTNERIKKQYYDRKGIGRNDPCPCGEKKENGQSKKYKRCCGR